MGNEPSHDPPETPADLQETLTREAPSPTVTPSVPLGKQAAVPELTAGQRFGSYRLIGLLGKGGFGEVWEAESLETGRRVALKVLTEARGASGADRERFRREARLAASLSHPSCVYVFGIEDAETEGLPAIAMELVRGGTLQDRLRREGPFPFRQAVDAALDVVEGLEVAGDKGVLHRDVKPSNCFVDEAGRVKIGDFGLSKSLDIDSSLTATGTFLGTPAYSSPEQVRGREMDFRSDMYSVGVTLYALLTGKPPFGGSAQQALARILTEDPAPLSDQEVHVPKGLERLMLRMMAKDREKRFASYSAARGALLPYSSRGLTAGGVARRTLAGVVDYVLFWLPTLPIAPEVVVHPGSTKAILSVVLGVALKFVYFFALETRWGKSLGKRLFGLRVVSSEGGDITVQQAVVRTAVFVGLVDLLGSIPALLRLSMDLVHVGVMIAGLVVGLALLACSMRGRNGYAGLHEVLSGTRVVAVPPRQAVTLPQSLREGGAAPAGPDLRFGPYRVVSTVWDTPGETLYTAEDAVLRRRVWIHRYRDGAGTRPMAELAASRPGRLHWLQGGREPDESWDAFEAPSGMSLVAWVREGERLSWAEMRTVLLGLATELEEVRKEAGSGRCSSVFRLWVDGVGRAKLLDFLGVLPRPGEDETAVALENWSGFLHQVALYGLEGRLLDVEGLAGQLPGTPVPEHARSLLDRICGGGEPFASPGALAAELEGLSHRPAVVTRGMRAAALGLTAAAPALMAIGSFFAMHTSALHSAFHDMKEILGQRESPEFAGEDPARREAKQTLLVHGYLKAKELARTEARPTLQGTFDWQSARAYIWALSDEDRRLLESLSEGRAPPSKAEVASARKLLGREEESGVAIGLRVCAGMLVLVAAFGLVCSPFFRGGATLALAGIGVQRRDGRRASRLRCLVRALVAWFPMLAYLVLRFFEIQRLASASIGVCLVTLGALLLSSARSAECRTSRRGPASFRGRCSEYGGSPQPVSRPFPGESPGQTSATGRRGPGAWSGGWMWSSQ